MRALFEAYPQLAGRLPHVALCDLPTPVAPLSRLGAALGLPALYVKRDDVSASLFGGNKVRALEFLLGEARTRKKRLALGLPGTSMALAANVYARQLGLELTTALIAQHPTVEAQQNLRYFQYLDADLHQIEQPRQIPIWLGLETATALIRHRQLPMILNPSSPRGLCGYANASFELKTQIAAGLLPEPDVLYIAMGLLGTATGLMLGLKAAGLKTRVVCVQVEPKDADQRREMKKKMGRLFQKTVNFLQQHDPAFPAITLTPDEIQIRGDTPGQTEGKLSGASDEIIEQVMNLERIQLDATWTAPAMIALVRDIQTEMLPDRTVLFWHTCNSRPYPEAVAAVDYQQLPPEFHHYFETDHLATINKPLFAGD